MNITTKYCAHCAEQVTTKQIGQKVHCTKCEKVLQELPVIPEQPEPPRLPGFGTAPTRTKRRGLGWGG